MATKSMGTLTLNLVMQMGGFEQGADRAERALDKVGKAADRQKADLMRLLGQIDPVVAEYDRLAKAGAKLKSSLDAGLIDQATFTAFNNKLAEQRKRLDQSGDGFAYGALSAKQYQQALRGMPAQITDIVVSLQAGQNPLTVFLQQGGQIKDMFGGIGPALSGMGRAVLGMINPVTVAAVAIGALGIAAVKGMNETAALGKSLAATGNSAGMTAGQLQAMAEGIDAVSESVTQGAASEVLVALVRDGRVAAGSMREVAEAIALMAATGEGDVAKLIEAFGKMKDDPVKAITELNKAYNFLTPAIYDQIRALKDQGDEERAIALAQETAAAAVKQRAAQVVEQTGYMERAWKAVKKVASEAWDDMLGIGRANQIDAEIAKIRKQIQVTESGGSYFSGGVGFGGIEEARARLAVLETQKDATEKAAKAQADQRKETDAYAKAQEAVAKAHDSSRSAVDRANESLKRYREQIEVIRKQTPGSALLDPALIARTEASIMAGAAGGKGRSAKGKDPLDAQLREMERAAKLEADLYRDRNQIIELYNSQNLLSIAEYYGAQRVALEENTVTQQAALDAQIALLRGKKDAQDKINALVAEGFALEREANARMTELSLRQRGAEEQKRIADALERVNDVRTEAGDILSQLQRDEDRINIARQLGAEGELGSLARLGEARRKAYDALKAQIDLYDRLEAIDPEGMTDKQRKALEKIAPQIDAIRLQAEKLAADLDPLGDKIGSIFEDAFADAFTDFVTGTKTAADAFRAFGNVVVNQLIRIAAQQAASAIFGGSSGSGGIGGFLSSLVSAAFGASGSTGPSAAAGGGTWLGNTSGFRLDGTRAEGGPVNPYGTYLVGEEGPELLQMGGRSGVVIPNDQMLGGGGTTVNVYNAPPGTTTRSSRRDGREFVEVFLADVAKGGEMAQAMQGAFNLSRTGR